MKKNTKNNFKSLFKSTIDNKALFERRKNSLLFPLIIFILIIFMMIVPPYISAMNMDEENIMKNFPQIHAPMEKLLTSSLDCKVKNGSLICAENAAEINVVVGDEIKYTVVANQKSFSSNTQTSYDSPKDTDNIILLLSNYIKIRYCVRDHVNQKIVSYEIIGDYSELENYNFKEISDKIASKETSVEDEITYFVTKSYYSTVDTRTLVSLSSSLFSLILFVFASSFILKFPTLLKKKKGFTFIECLKISLTSSLPALIISSILHFFGSVEFYLSFALIYLARILFIYFKYFYGSKNNIYAELYKDTKEERFNIQ